MAIFVIGDLHLSLGADKPMDVFPGWEGYLPKLERNWRALIAPEDTVVLAGDTSWAMKLEDTRADFAFFAVAARPEMAAERQPRLLVDDGPQDGELPCRRRLRQPAHPA